MSEHILHVSDDSFESEVLKSTVPVLVDFWAEWCGPCKMIAPVLEEIAADFSDKLTVAKLNIDENPQTPQKFNIRSIPTLLLFSGGSVAAQQVGAVNKAQLKSFLDQHLGGN